ncbi:unnamed protein product [Rotaria sp. Silwood2]|nr:unnamed protein product [Rotaria sp. Silwood2]CAF4214113.1 unnamed protein product [Rotaria sp. Silwood2]CAF4583219.1 unnamed protein product [Rotaria sp. Silwood2]
MARFVKEYVSADDQCDLAKGLWSLYQAHVGAAQSMSFSERDQLLLIQGLYVGLEEQTRLQSFINESLPGYMVQWCRFWPTRNVTKCREFLNKIATELIVHLFIGSHRLNTDEDVPSGMHNGSNFSLFLTKLANPEAYALMAAMLNQTTLQLKNTAASDWNILAQRMRFISAVFWVFQDHEDLNCYLFSAEQDLLIRTDQSDKLDPQSWFQICDRDCCAANGRWDGLN